MSWAEGRPSEETQELWEDRDSCRGLVVRWPASCGSISGGWRSETIGNGGSYIKWIFAICAISVIWLK
jgi:hypothetical protein